MQIKSLSYAKSIISILEELGIDTTDLLFLSYILLVGKMDRDVTYGDSFTTNKGENVRIWYKWTTDDKYILCYDIE